MAITHTRKFVRAKMSTNKVSKLAVFIEKYLEGGQLLRSCLFMPLHISRIFKESSHWKLFEVETLAGMLILLIFIRCAF